MIEPIMIKFELIFRFNDSFLWHSIENMEDLHVQQYCIYWTDCTSVSACYSSQIKNGVYSD